MDNADSAPGSTDISACLCRAGFFGDGTTSCEACTDNADSPPGSTDMSACLCRAGFFGDGTTSCEACAPGTYAISPGSSTCSLCPEGTFEHEAGASNCKPCPGNTASPPGSTNQSTCRNREPPIPLISGPKSTMSMAPPVDHSLTEYTHWLCGHGSTEALPHNTAGYGSCVASLFSSLQLSGLPDCKSPAFAGLDLQLTVVKRDFYGQLMASDDTSTLQLYSALNGDKDNDESVSFLGPVFSGIKKGRAVFVISVKPTFSHVSEQQGISNLLRRVYIYVAGQDAASGVTMQSDTRMVHLASGNLSVCPVGSVLVLDTPSLPSGGACFRCAAGKYNVNPLAGECLACPPSAVCPNGAPPLFAASKVTAVIAMELPSGSSEEATREAIASKIGMHLWQLSILRVRQQDRRRMQLVQFEIVADKAQMDKLVSQAKAIGMELSDTESLSAASEGEVWEGSGGHFYLRQCPLGHRLINTTEPAVLAARCTPCPPTTYIIDPLGPCVDCPVGASCPDGTRFVPHAVGSVWEEVRMKNVDQTMVKRIVECPAGHALEFDEALPVNDNCRPCKPNTYRLDPSVRNSSSKGCIPCDPKATCPGGEVVEAVEGYWRVSPVLWDDFTEYLPGAACRVEGRPCLFPSEGFVLFQQWKEEQMTCRPLPGGGDDLFCARPIQRQGHTTSSLDGNDSRVHIVRCPTGACASNNTCLTNRTGPGVPSPCLNAFVLPTIHFHSGCLPLLSSPSCTLQLVHSLYLQKH